MVFFSSINNYYCMFSISGTFFAKWDRNFFFNNKNSFKWSRVPLSRGYCILCISDFFTRKYNLIIIMIYHNKFIAEIRIGQEEFCRRKIPNARQTHVNV